MSVAITCPSLTDIDGSGTSNAGAARPRPGSFALAEQSKRSLVVRASVAHRSHSFISARQRSRLCLHCIATLLRPRDGNAKTPRPDDAPDRNRRARGAVALANKPRRRHDRLIQRPTAVLGNGEQWRVYLSGQCGVRVEHHHTEHDGGSSNRSHDGPWLAECHHVRWLEHRRRRGAHPNVPRPRRRGLDTWHVQWRGRPRHCEHTGMRCKRRRDRCLRGVCQYVPREFSCVLRRKSVFHRRQCGVDCRKYDCGVSGERSVL